MKREIVVQYATKLLNDREKLGKIRAIRDSRGMAVADEARLIANILEIPSENRLSVNGLIRVCESIFKLAEDMASVNDHNLVVGRTVRFVNRYTLTSNPEIAWSEGEIELITANYRIRIKRNDGITETFRPCHYLFS